MRRTDTVSRTRAQGLTLTLTVMALAAALGGCGRRSAGPAEVSDSAFVGAMVELRRLDTTVTADSAARAAARAAVLQRRGLTAAQLERAASALADDPDRAQRVFATIDSTVATRDSSGRRPPPPPPAAAPPKGRVP